MKIYISNAIATLEIGKIIPKKLMIAPLSLSSILVNDYQECSFHCGGSSCIIECRYMFRFLDSDSTYCWRPLKRKSLVCVLDGQELYSFYDIIFEYFKLPLFYDNKLREWKLDSEKLIDWNNS